MTTEGQQLCQNLIITPLRGTRQISKEEFLRRFPSAVERGALAPKLLEDVCNAQSAQDLYCALVVGFTFGFAPEYMGILRRLIDVDWHSSHEDVVSALQTWPLADNVEALFRATQWIPTALEYDDNRALAVKAIWALGKIPGPEAEMKLEALARSDDAILRANAANQLTRRHNTA